MSSPDRNHLDSYLDAVLIGGREERTVEMEDYTPGWEERYASEMRRISDALGPSVRRIEHIGSTAVPGLAAKPIVDIMVTVDDANDESGFLHQLEEVGYVLRVREAGHRMFRTPARDVHVHVWASGSEDERRHLLFRDWLRHDAADRAKYESTKRSLAGHYADGNYYAEAKTEVIEGILQRARRAGTPYPEPSRFVSPDTGRNQERL